MKKRSFIFIAIIIIGIILIAFNSHFKKEREYYRNVSDLVVGLFHSSTYDKEVLKEEDIPALEAYLSTLTHKDELICVSDYVQKEDYYKTDKKNSKNIFLKSDGKCYTYFENLNIATAKENVDLEMEPFDVLHCNGYEVVLYRSMFKPDFIDIKNNPRYDYMFMDSNEESDVKEFNYTSIYDGTKITVEIETEDKTITKINVIDREI